MVVLKIDKLRGFPKDNKKENHGEFDNTHQEEHQIHRNYIHHENGIKNNITNFMEKNTDKKSAQFETTDGDQNNQHLSKV